VLLLAGCASTQPGSDGEDFVNDPFEDVNRGIFAFNRTVDGLILKPAAQIYRGVVPELGREGVANVLENWTLPVTFLNDVLQGDQDRASETLGRFMLNSSVGLLGLLDVATYVGAEPVHDEDFGQTLAVWGAEEGPYLMLPVLGPSNPRDAIGRVADTLADPLTWVILSETEGLARMGATAVDTRSRYLDEMDELEKTSIDFYAALRSLYRQHRNSEIHNGEVPIEDYIVVPEEFEDE
jgi:phospholipid-binding lipoprotein MlaA